MRDKIQIWAEDAYNKNEIIRHRVKRLVIRKQTQFQKIEIFDLFDYGLSLFIDGIPQSAAKDEWIYHECLVHPAMLLCANRKDFQVLVLGTGEGASLRELLKYKFVKNIDAVDVDRQAVDICQKYLGDIHENSYYHERVNLIIKSAGDFLKDTTNKYDVIISDITDIDFINLGSKNLREQKDFYILIKDRLKVNGILAMHSSELTEIHNNKHLALKGVIQDVFTNVFSYRVYVPFFECPWGFLLATDKKRFDPVKITERQFQNIIDTKAKYKFITPRKLRALFSINIVPQSLRW